MIKLNEKGSFLWSVSSQIIVGSIFLLIILGVIMLTLEMFFPEFWGQVAVYLSETELLSTFNIFVAVALVVFLANLRPTTSNKVKEKNIEWGRV